MADLHVESEHRSSVTPLVLSAVVILSLLYFLAKGCTSHAEHETAVSSHGATTSSHEAPVAATHPEAAAGATWNDVDFNAPAATFEEITDKNISVRGNNNYAIYGLGENILFDEGQSTIKPDAEQNLKQITGSIEKRYHGASLRVFGYTDAVGSAGYNKQLAGQRAEAVKEWLVKNGNVAENTISVQPVGEARPVASNATGEGRQQNRRVEIVAMGAEGEK